MFPTVIDNQFFNHPDKVNGFINSLDFNENNENYPGVRTACLSTIDFDLFNSIFLKVLSNFYSADDLMDCEFTGSLQGQKINEKYNGGWIHTDVPDLLSFVIYLEPNADITTGTSIYKVKDEYTNLSNYTTMYNKLDAKEKCFTNPTPENIELAEQYRLENNQYFEKTVEVGNVYNTMIAFSSNEIHGQNKLDTGNRLTLIGFLKEFSLPLPNVRKYNIYI